MRQKRLYSEQIELVAAATDSIRDSLRDRLCAEPETRGSKILRLLEEAYQRLNEAAENVAALE